MKWQNLGFFEMIYPTQKDEFEERPKSVQHWKLQIRYGVKIRIDALRTTDFNPGL